MESFVSSFHGEIVTADGDPAKYDEAIRRWSHAATRKAKIVVYPKDPEDIKLALGYAQANNLDLAVRCGGHATSGASSVQGGLVIDLSRHFGGVRVDAENRLGYVGGGAVWKTVDTEAIKHGLATVGGTVNHTGVAGLTLGGGYGYMTGQYGLTIDNLVQVTLITAAGETLVASDTSNQDLFFAVRGGGGNFGIVTEFVFRLYPQRANVFAGVLVFPPTALERLVEHVEERRHRDRPKESLFLAFGQGPNKQAAILAIIFYNGSEAEGREVYKDLYEVGPVVDNAKEIPYEMVNAMLNERVGDGENVYQTGVAMSSLRVPTVRAAFDRFSEILSEGAKAGIKNFTGIVLLEISDPAKLLTVPRGTTAFNSRGRQFIAVIMLKWSATTALGVADEHVPTCRSWGKSLSDIFGAGEQIDEDENSGYGNYHSDQSTEDQVKRLFGSNYPRLQELKKKYDPKVIFNKWQVIQPAT